MKHKYMLLESQLDKGEIDQDTYVAAIDVLRKEELANDAKESELSKAVSAAKKGMMEAKKPEDVMAAYLKKVEAEKALLDFKLSIMSDEEIKAQEAVDEAQTKFDEAKKELEDARQKLAIFKPEIAKSAPSGERRTAVGPPPAATIKANMEIIIAMAKAGKGVTEIGKHLGFTKEQGYCGNSLRPIIAANK